MQFRDIIGQDEVKQRLLQSVKDNRISHAQLFCGPEGSGSLPLALAYAQYISCTGKTANDSCGTCSSCNKFSKLAHPDLHLTFPVILSKDVRTSDNLMKEFREAFLQSPYLSLFDWISFLEGENKQGVIGVEESAAILRKLSLTTYETEFKTVVIWMPEKMNTAAANKLLKILEEPPDKTLFVLVTGNEDQLLRTIVSRTQLIKVPKIADQDLREALMRRHGMDEKNAKRIAYLSEGSYRAALGNLSQHDASEWNNHQEFAGWMRSCFRSDMREVLNWTETVARIGRERQKDFVSYALSMFRECLMMNFGSAALVRLSGDEMEFVKKFAPYITGTNASVLIEQFNRAIGHIERNANPKILFIHLSLHCMELLRKPLPVKN